MNTRIDYLYTDGNNYKKHNSVVVTGTFTEEQVSDIIEALDSEEFFIPSLVGLPEERFDKYDPKEDHPWFSLEASGFSETNDSPSLELTSEELYEKFMAHTAEKGGWEAQN